MGWRKATHRVPDKFSLLYGASAGIAKAEIRSQLLSLSNQMVEAQWSVREGKLTGLKFVIRGTGAENALPRDPFLLILKDGTSVRASEMTFVERPANRGAARRSRRIACR